MGVLAFKDVNLSQQLVRLDNSVNLPVESQTGMEHTIVTFYSDSGVVVQTFYRFA